MIPPHSCSVPGRKPGTSTNVSSGMLKASQVRTKRAAFAEASMSSTPGERRGLVADDADRDAVQAREAADDVARVVLVDLEELAVVDDHAGSRRACRRACSGCRGRPRRARGPSAAGRRRASARGVDSRLFCGRNESR